MLEVSDFIIRVVVALVLGALLGYEREKIGKAAGMRTYALVSIGTAVFTMVSQYGFEGATVDPTRIAAQVVVGIGFIGAGLILHVRNNVRGLTTAAGLWATAALGIVVGIGWYAAAIILTIILFCVFSSATAFRVKTNREWWRFWGR